MPVDQPISGKPTLSTITDDDTVYGNDAPSTTHSLVQWAWTTVKAYCQNGVELLSRKGAANGYAPLDASSKVPSANLPTLASGVSSFNGRTGAVVLTVADIRALMTDALGALPLAEMVSTDGRTGTHIYVGVNDPTSVAGGSKVAVNGDVEISDA